MIVCKTLLALVYCAATLQLTKANPTDYEKHSHGLDEYNSIEFDRTEYNAHQSGKYWKRRDCPKLGNSLPGLTLQSCKQRCTQHPKCTAIHYKSSDKHCELVNCPIPIPEPLGSHGPWRGYSLDPTQEQLKKNEQLGKHEQLEYNAHQSGKYWKRRDCPKLGSSLSGLTLHSCKQRCKQHPKCTAIHYDSSGKHCELVNCPIPFPELLGTNELWRGYSSDSKEYDAHQSGKYWKRWQCPKLGNSLSGLTLHSCKQRCTRHHKCTAIHYQSSGKYCELVNCPIPAQEPLGNNELWRGYSSKPTQEPEYDAHQSGKYWKKWQCPKLDNSLSGLTLQSCKQRCTRHHKCTAVHYQSSGKHCELVNCPIPAQEPLGNNELWRGYSFDLTP